MSAGLMSTSVNFCPVIITCLKVSKVPGLQFLKTLKNFFLEIKYNREILNTHLTVVFKLFLI